MHKLDRMLLPVLLVAALGSFPAATARAQEAAKEARDPCPTGKYQPGRDTPWTPTPDALVEAMLDLVELTPQDYVIDLGSGDGRMVIAAARRGTPGHGVEYNPDMVECANRRAREAGVADKARFVRGDMYVADISRATVLPLFLLTENLDQLMPTFLQLRPGTRIAANEFKITGWEEDKTVTLQAGCSPWCTAHLWIVPARVGGSWRLDGVGELTLKQEFQKITGTLSSKDGTQQVTGRLRGERISFKAGDAEYTGTVQGHAMRGQSGSRTWSAARKGP